MNWNRIKCAVLGHKWQVREGHPSSDVRAPADRTQCGEHHSGIDWSRVPQMPPVRNPRPPLSGYQPRPHGAPMNPAPPPVDPGGWRERAEQQERDDWFEREIDRLEARIRALEVSNTTSSR